MKKYRDTYYKTVHAVLELARAEILEERSMPIDLWRKIPIKTTTCYFFKGTLIFYDMDSREWYSVIKDEYGSIKNYKNITTLVKSGDILSEIDDPDLLNKILFNLDQIKKL